MTATSPSFGAQGPYDKFPLLLAVVSDLLSSPCRVTLRLRYYPKDFVQEFMAEALSFLLRNAPTQQLIKGDLGFSTVVVPYMDI